MATVFVMMIWTLTSNRKELVASYDNKDRVAEEKFLDSNRNETKEK